MNDFAEPLYRIMLFLVSWFRWIVGFQKIVSQESVKKLSPKEKYIELQKNRFLQTFKVEGTHDWNSNIDAIIKDKTQLAELLKDNQTELEKKWRARVLIENTPRGNVIVFYDIYKRAFSYYCDQAVMPYDIMNAVAMKYVLTFRCRDFFVDSNLLPSSSPILEPREEDTKNQNSTTANNRCAALATLNAQVVASAEQRVRGFNKHSAGEFPKGTRIENAKLDKQAFAKFKTYNNATKKAGILPENDKTINCFLHLGASRNWLPISKKTKPNPLNGFQTDLIPNSSNNKISYLDYKNKMK